MEIEIFCDETEISDKFGNEYLGIGCLFIPTKNKENIIKKLLNLRCLNPDSELWTWDYENCPNKCRKDYHYDINNTEIHFREIEKNMAKGKFKIYEKWVDFLINNNKIEDSEDKYIYFNILYIDLKKLDFNIFGVDKDITNIYNRFFRTTIFYGLNSFFNDEKIVINEIFHDIADEKEKHKYFSWHIFKKLKNHKNVIFKKDEITFIDSHHKKQEICKLKENSQLIQLTDLILGCSNQILFRKSKDKNKIKIASKFYPLFERLWNKPFNKNSECNYYKSQRVSIFPKHKLKRDQLGKSLRKDKQFHNNIYIEQPEENNQSFLDNWY